MATLLPSLSSDDEVAPPPRGMGAVDPEDDDSDGDEEVIDRSFQFGGILGEDGGWQAENGLGGSNNMKKKTVWSYQQILQKLEDQTQESEASKKNPRMDVTSLIEAKRQAILQKKHGKAKLENIKGAGSDSKRDSNQDHSSNDSHNDEENSVSGSSDGSSNSEDDSDGGNESSSSSDDTERPAVDPNLATMEDDVVKTRAGTAFTNSQKTKGSDGEQKDSGADNSEDDDGDDEPARDSDNYHDDAADDRQEAEKAAAFFDNQSLRDNVGTATIEVFSQLALSRPLLRGVAAMGFIRPTPIQASVIPLALSGRDVCASAVTGSGKTAAFLLPLLERLLHRSTAGHRSSIKAVVLAPTRELAAQCVAFGTAMAQFTALRVCLITGGSKNTMAQQAELRARPELVVATPGRLLDHVLNSPGVTLESVEFLVLDEADRLLDLGFQEEVHELLRHCPAERRQTMLFSATMNTKVDDLARLSLKRPVRVRTTTTTGETAAGGQPRPPTATKDVEVAPRLEQEFVRVRAGNEGVNREGMLLALLTRTFRSQTIVFFDTKAEAHRMMIICGLCGIRCSELHGNLTQQQRLQALEEFKMGRVDVLLASDLACRGLDIDSVRAVINFEMPSNLDTYIHRIGRTARAGRGGQSCTLIGESRRHLMKEIIRNAEAARKNGNNRDGPAESSLAARVGVVKSRTIPPTVVAHFVDKIRDLEPHIEEVLQAEAVAKMDRLAEMEAIKVQNIIEHSDEIQSRPRKEWFASKSEKERTRQSAAEKQRQIDEKVGTGTHRMTRKKRRAREALAALNSAPDEPPRDGDEEAGEGDVTPSSSNKKQQQQQTVNIKADARKKKKVDAARILEASEKSLRELDEEREARTNAAVNHRKKRKASALSSSSGGHAPGDGSLFDEDKIAHSGRAKKKKEEAMSDSATAMSSYQFRGYDPNRRLGKKRGNKSFKSKSKYKRRK